MKKFLGLKEREREKEKEREKSKRKHHLHFQHSHTVQQATQQSQHHPPPSPRIAQHNPPPPSPRVAHSQQQHHAEQFSQPPQLQRTHSLASTKSSSTINQLPSSNPVSNNTTKPPIPIETSIQTRNTNPSSLNVSTPITTTISNHKSRPPSVHGSISSSKSSSSNDNLELQQHNPQNQPQSELLLQPQVSQTHQLQHSNFQINPNVEMPIDSNSYLSSSFNKNLSSNMDDSYSNIVNADSTILNDTFDKTIDENDKLKIVDSNNTISQLQPPPRSKSVSNESQTVPVDPIFQTPPPQPTAITLLSSSPAESPLTPSSATFSDDSNSYNSVSNSRNPSQSHMVLQQPPLSAQTELRRESNTSSIQPPRRESISSITPSIPRRESVVSVTSNLTNTGSNVELGKKTSTNEIKKATRHVISKVSSSSRSNYTPSIYSMEQSFLSVNRQNVLNNSAASTSQYFKGSSSSSANQYPLSMLVKQDWDNHTEKSGWVNRVLEPSEPRLFRLELKGSYLLVHKPQQELAYAKNLIINNKPLSSSDANIDADLIKNKSDLASIHPNKPESENKINEETEEELDHDDVANNTVIDGHSAANNNNQNKIDENANNDSVLLSRAIDEYESKPSFNDDKDKELQDINDQREREMEFHSVEMNKKLSINNSQKKHLPFIIHDLFYQSPSCPHPKLVFDMTSGLILRGTLEAICHTILFYPSDRMAEKMVEILPLIGSLIDPLVYFQKYLEHFTDAETLKKKSIHISEMEMKMLFTRIKRIIELTLEKFNGSLLDDEIFALLIKLVSTLSMKSIGYLKETEVSNLSNKLIAQRSSLLKLVSFELASPADNVSSPIEISKISSSELLSGEDFIMLSTEALAHEIHAIDAHFMKHWATRSDRSTIFSRLETIEASYQYWRFNPLQFIPSLHTHYLGRLLAFHLFEDGTTSCSAVKRARVLMKWIHLGTLLSEQGDMVSWLGIAIMMCSQPVLRLSETWGNVDQTSLEIIKKKWAPVVFEVRKKEIFGTKHPLDTHEYSTDINSNNISNDSPSMDSTSKNDATSNIRIMLANNVGELYAKEDAIPHFGELFTADTADIKKYALSTINMGNDDMYAAERESKDLLKTDFIKYYCSYLEVVDYNLKQWDAYYDGIVNEATVKSKFSIPDDPTNDDASIIHGSKDSEISNVLKLAITFNASNGPFPLNSFMTFSTIVEPPYVGQFARFHGTSRSPLFLGSYASILFPQLLPYYGIYDRRELISAIGGSSIIELKEPGKRKNRNLSLKHVRDLFNVGSEEFRLKDGSIIFKTTENFNDSSKDAERTKKSRPSSLLFDNPTQSKHLSTLSMGSFTLEDYIISYQTYLKDAISTSNTPNISSTATMSASDTIVPNLGDSVSTNKPVASAEVGHSRNVDIVTSAASTERLVDLLVLTASIFGTYITMEDIKKYSEKTANEGPILLQMDDSAFTCTFFATYRVFFTTKQLIDSLHKRFEGSKSAALSIARFMNSTGSVADQSANIFPQWDNKIADNHETWNNINWKFVVQIQLGVLEATLILVNDYFRHFLDDIITKATFDSFLEMMDVTIVSEWPKILTWLKNNSTVDVVNEVVDVYRSLQGVYKQLRNLCIRKSYTPQCEVIELNFSDELNKIPKYMDLPASDDIEQIVSFIDKLDETISAVLSQVRTDDWIDTFEMIQMLITKSPLSMFNYSYQDSSTHSDLILISNIYNWITTLSDSENFSKSPSDKLVNKLPPPIRSIFKLYDRIQKYLLIQLVDAECTLDERVERMSSLLKIIQICRSRMENVKLFEDDNESVGAYLPSFIESVVVNTIMLPESRFFSPAWKLAAENLKVDSDENDISYNHLKDMLPELTDAEVKASGSNPLSICPGWFLSRLIELACFIPNMDVDNTTLVNFDKNRFVYNCVLKIHGLQSKLNKAASPYMSEFSFLFEYEPSLPSLKTIYQISSNEKHVEKLEKCSVFGAHVAEQLQLIKLEQAKRDLLLRQREKQNSSMIDSINKFNAHMTEPLPIETNHSNTDVMSIMTGTTANDQSFLANSSIMDSASTYVDNNSILETSSITTSNIADQSMYSVQSAQSSATLTRPSASATSRANKQSSTLTQSQSVQTSVQQSQQQQSQPQASSSSSSSGSQSRHGHHHHGSSSNPVSKLKFGLFKSRPFSLNINNFNQPDTEKRSVTLAELPVAANCIAKQKPHITIMLKDVSIFPTVRAPNSFTIDVGSSSSTHEYTFQTSTERDLEDWNYHLTYAKKHWFYSKTLNKQFSHNNARLTFGAPLAFVCDRDGMAIPMIVEKILCEIELRGLEEVGIYRKSASLTVVQQIRDEVNKIGDFNMENSLVFDIHNLTGCIKAYLRDLPDPLISDELVKEISKVREVARDDSRFQLYKTILPKLPVYNYNLIERLSRHMKMIEEYKSQNRMTSYNLATIMGGSLVEGCRPETMRESFGLMNFICEDWILHYERVFQ